MMLYKHVIMHVLTWHDPGCRWTLHIRLSCAGSTMLMTLPVVPVVLPATLLTEMRSFPSQSTQYATVFCMAQAQRPLFTEKIRAFETCKGQSRLSPLHVPWQLRPQLLPCFAYCCTCLHISAGHRELITEGHGLLQKPLLDHLADVQT